MIRESDPDALRDHITSTYFSLRVAIGAVAFALPIVLYVVGKASGVGLQPSISDYYPHGTEATRNVFVGSLFAVGACLIAYRGFSDVENISLNVAGVLAPLIALFPCQCNDPDAKATPHGFFAVSFFIVIAFVCIKCGPETLDLMREAGRQDDANRYARLYRGLGIFMAISPVAAAGLSLVIGQFEKLRLFAEVFGIYTFASYWLVKSRELETTQADALAVTGRAVRSRRAVKRAERQVV